MTASRVVSQSPTARLLVGLMVTMGAVAMYSWYTLSQLHGLRQLQTTIVDRNRRDSLQLLRMENDLSQIGLALRDMAGDAEPYGLLAYQNELADKRVDLEDSLKEERTYSPSNRLPEQQRQLELTVQQFWQTVDQMFALAKEGKRAQAKEMAATSLAAQQSTLSTDVARLLIRNNTAEEEAGAAITAIYTRVERDIYAFLAAMLLAIAVTGLGLIYSNRRIFAAMNALAQQRRVLAAKLITIQEEVLRSVSRELHDEFGQILTAIGAMLGRAERKGLPPDSPFRAELSEVRQITQETLEKMRSLSQMLHPTVLDDYGLVNGLDWYVQVFQKQAGVETSLEVEGDVEKVTGQAAIHCFRIVQEALTNAVKHGKTKTAEVSLEFKPKRLTLRVRDHGVGLPREKREGGVGLGMVAMRQRAELMRGTVEVNAAEGGGTLVVLRIPLPQEEGQAYLTQAKQETQVVTHD